MKAIARFILCMVIGFVSHRAVYLTRKLPDGWQNLTDHTIGYVTVTPLILFWWRFLHKSGATKEQIENEYLSATALAGLGYGIGNALAWLHERVTEY